jgi:hypoxanthine phosphoribosyltransferase
MYPVRVTATVTKDATAIVLNDMNKTYYSWHQFDKDIVYLARQIYNSKWRPDYIVGITRGGLPAAVSLSNFLKVPMHSLGVQLRDGGDDGCESNLWMAEDAYGHVADAQGHGYSDSKARKNILIVDDINDTGATLNWITEDWPSGCFPNDLQWQGIWNKNVKFATLWDNPASKSKYVVDYCCNTKPEDTWIVFPWEETFVGI